MIYWFIRTFFPCLNHAWGSYTVMHEPCGMVTYWGCIRCGEVPDVELMRYIIEHDGLPA